MVSFFHQCLFHRLFWQCLSSCSCTHFLVLFLCFLFRSPAENWALHMKQCRHESFMSSVVHSSSPSLRSAILPQRRGRQSRCQGSTARSLAAYSLQTWPLIPIQRIPILNKIQTCLRLTLISRHSLRRRWSHLMPKLYRLCPQHPVQAELPLCTSLPPYCLTVTMPLPAHLRRLPCLKPVRLWFSLNVMHQ